MPSFKDLSVIEVTLPDQSQYIFDGTAPQFGRPFGSLLLVPKQRYEANYISQAAWGQFWEHGLHQKTRLQVSFENADKGYWPAVQSYLRVMMERLDWDGLAGQSVSDIADRVEKQTLDDFQPLVDSFFSPSSSDHTSFRRL